MSSKNKKHKIGKKERADIIIAIVVILLFIVFGFSLVQYDVLEAPIIEANASNAVISNDIELDKTPEVIEEDMIMEINGSYYEIDQATSESIDLSSHYVPSDSTRLINQSQAGIKQSMEIDSATSAYTADSMSFFDNSSTVDYASDEIDYEEETDVIDNSVSSTPQRMDQVEENQEPIKDCIIVIGVFGNPINVKRLQRRLDRANFDHFTSPFKSLTRVAVRVSCLENEYLPILTKIRAEYAQDAVLLKS